MSNDSYTSELWGMLVSVDLYGCNPETIRDAEKIREFVYKLCDRLKVKRFGECRVEHFGEDEKVAGYSMVQLIETSLVSGHFANKTNAAYIDIFSCKYFDKDSAVEFSKQFFEATTAKSHLTIRE